jgi:hypothetical protein
VDLARIVQGFLFSNLVFAIRMTYSSCALLSGYAAWTTRELALSDVLLHPAPVDDGRDAVILLFLLQLNSTAVSFMFLHSSED